jgi:hypothetical protein
VNRSEVAMVVATAADVLIVDLSKV